MAPRSAFNAAVAGFVLAATGARAHGIASALVVFPTGTFYKGYNPSYQYEKPPPTVVGWSTPDDLQNAFVSPSGYDGPDIACHVGATPAGAEAPVNAGDTIEVQWTPWPASHKGPVIDYLAKCDGSCTTADKSKLKFFKISEVGLVDAAKDVWGATQLMNNNNSWLVTIPTGIAPGNYVLRHEIIALHAAGQTNGAQNYPFCYSLAISSDGTANPEGVLATSFYKPADPGIHFDLFVKYTDYPIPGPPLYSGAVKIAQSKGPAIKGTANGIPSLVIQAKPTGGAVAASSAGTAATPATPATLATPATGATKLSTLTTALATAQGKQTIYTTKVGTTRVTVTTHLRVTMTTTLAKAVKTGSH